MLALTALITVAQPQVTWLERQHDFGVFKEENGKVRCHIRMVNTGNEPLLVVKTQVGCGCTGTKYPESPIQPGDTAAIEISYDPSGRPGEFSKRIIIFTNTVPQRTTLEIMGNVIPTAASLNKQYPVQAGSLRISQRILPFGELTRGKNSTQYLSAYNASTDTIVVTVAGDKSHIRPAVVPDTVPPARVTALTVHYLSGHAPQWGLNVDTLTLNCTPLRQPSNAIAGTTTVNVMAQVLESFDELTDKERRDAPVVSMDCGDRIDFGTFKEESNKVARTFTITNKGKNPLIIRRLWVPDGEGFNVNVNRTEVKRGKSATVIVTAQAEKLKGDVINVPLTVMSNDPETPRLTIRLVGLNDQQ